MIGFVRTMLEADLQFTFIRSRPPGLFQPIYKKKLPINMCTCIAFSSGNRDHYVRPVPMPLALFPSNPYAAVLLQRPNNLQLRQRS